MKLQHLNNVTLFFTREKVLKYYIERSSIILKTMATEVIKKDGQREPFNPDKIRDAIWAAAQRTDLSDEDKEEIVERVASKVIEMFEDVDIVATTEIRDAILEELDSVSPEIANSWREYEKNK